MRVIDLSAEELRVDSKERARNVDFCNGGGFQHHADIFPVRSVQNVLVALMLLLFPGSNLRAARGEERHIDDEKNAFVCVCVCVCVFALLRLFARTNLCCFSSFFDFSIYIIKCLLLVRQSRRFEQTKRKNTLTTRGSANICLRAPYHGAFKFYSYKTRFSFGNENRCARALERERV